MNKEEFEKIVKETKVTGATINTGDPLQDLMSEVYWEGYKDGRQSAINLIQLVGPSLLSTRMREFLDGNMDRIHRRVDAIREHQKEKNENRQEASNEDNKDWR